MFNTKKMHRIIIISKFNLKNKCKYGYKCKFRHINVHKVNEIISELEDLRRENKSLKLVRSFDTN